MRDDAQLAARAATGDQDAAEALLRRHAEAVFGYLWRRLGNVHDAEDAAQETFMRALRGLDRYREQGTFKAWLFRIAQREGLRILRRQAKSGRVVVLDGADGEAVTAPGPDERAIRSEDVARVRAALETLGERERHVVMLRTYGGLTFREIADVVGAPLNTVLARMHRATQRLRGLLREE